MADKTFPNPLGRALRAARKARGLTQAQLAAQAGLSIPTLRLLEQGRGRLASWATVLASLNLQLRGSNLPSAATIGQSISVLRKRSGLSLSRLALAAHLSKPTLIALEKRTIGTLTSLTQALAALDASPKLVPNGAPLPFYSHAATSSGFHSWQTPAWLLERLYTVFGRFDLDPCSPTRNGRRAPVRARKRFTQEDDGLALPWYGTVFLNPPYGRDLHRWTAKAKREFTSRRATTVVALVPARTDTTWWHRDIAGSACVLFLKGRLSFGKGGQSAPFPSALVIWGASSDTLAHLQRQFPEAQLVGATLEPNQSDHR